MLYKSNYIILFLIVIFALSSCEKAFFEKEFSTTDPFDNFEYLWKECDEKYAYFEVKNIDWDAVKVAYAAKLYKGMSQDSLFSVLGGMLTELRDDHTNLVSDFNVSSFGVRYLGQDNFDWRIIIDNYITKDFYRTGPFSHNFLDNGEIGYIRFPSFTGAINATNINFVLDRYKDTKGLIFDLRENGGGAVSDVFSILSILVDVNTLVNYSRIKNGPGHNDFSEPAPVYVAGHGGTPYTKNIKVLIDRGTYSAGSFTALATKALDNVVLIGDTTGGGLGVPNGGQLPNGWTYRFSITQALTLDKSPEFENGVPPDIPVLFDWNDVTKDEILERAITELQ